MSETTTAPARRRDRPAPSQPLVVNIQYVKDMSFEVPGAPAIYPAAQPAARRHQSRRPGPPDRANQDSYEVVLVIRAEAHAHPRPAAAHRQAGAAMRRPSSWPS